MPDGDGRNLCMQHVSCQYGMCLVRKQFRVILLLCLCDIMQYDCIPVSWGFGGLWFEVRADLSCTCSECCVLGKSNGEIGNGAEPLSSEFHVRGHAC